MSLAFENEGMRLKEEVLNNPKLHRQYEQDKASLFVDESTPESYAQTKNQYGLLKVECTLNFPIDCMQHVFPFQVEYRCSKALYVASKQYFLLHEDKKATKVNYFGIHYGNEILATHSD
ncbi:MAG: hypothetical protein GY816_11000 [Cytophagales bacterium]|nr:hypothetical protein [Cytophagales bacterium]